MQKIGAYFVGWIVAAPLQEPSMNRLVVSLVLSAFALGANAQSQAPDTTAQSQDKAAEVTVISGADAQVQDRNCLRETGSHIVRSDKDKAKGKSACINATGRSYTKEDIDRTGTTDLADALRHLDPAVHISHN
jgi:hypothetical protein